MSGSQQRERGMILVIALLFMTILTIIGITAPNTGVLDEKMARNSRDYNIAFQAAEAALRDARTDLLGLGTRNPVIIGSVGFVTACTAGLCIRAVSGQPEVWDIAVNWTDNTRSVRYATYTTAQQFPTTPTPGGVSQPPRYLIEWLSTSGSQNFYRITARAWGASANTVVTLQEEVVK